MFLYVIFRINSVQFTVMRGLSDEQDACFINRFGVIAGGFIHIRVRGRSRKSPCADIIGTGNTDHQIRSGNCVNAGYP